MVEDRFERQAQFGRAVEEAWQRNKLGTFQEAYERTDVDTTTLIRMRKNGIAPGVGLLIKWAKGIGEPINRWLELAGHEPIPPELVCESRAPYNLREVEVDGVTFAVPADVEYTEDRLREIAELVKGDQAALKEKHEKEVR